MDKINCVITATHSLMLDGFLFRAGDGVSLPLDQAEYYKSVGIVDFGSPAIEQDNQEEGG